VANFGRKKNQAEEYTLEKCNQTEEKCKGFDREI
jgi:hypothetical protein